MEQILHECVITLAKSGCVVTLPEIASAPHCRDGMPGRPMGGSLGAKHLTYSISFNPDPKKKKKRGVNSYNLVPH